MSAGLPVDHDDRERARLRLGANIVVEAGAGTGKTTLLIDRLVFQLLAGAQAVEVTKLVALTFTEKAAAEIKVRLADKLSEAAADSERKEAARLARRALEDLDKAQIGTIHAFAASVLRSFPVEARVDPGFMVDEGPVFAELFEAEWAAFLDRELGESPPRAGEWLSALRLCPLEDLRALAQELCRERLDLDAVGRPDPDTAGDLERLAERLERLPATLPSPGPRSKIKESIGTAGARLRQIAAAARARAPDLPERLSQEELKGSSWPKAWEDFPEEKALYERAIESAAATTAAREALTRRACALVLPLARRFRAIYTRRGFVSFDGLLRRARDLVRDHPAAREELKRRYAALFIDEFQDTDPLQGEFLLFLAEAPGRCAGRWQEVILGPGRLFVVGDPKQSIYRFRGADIAAYQLFTTRILESREAAACDLLANFRSHEGLLGPVNSLFARLMRPLPGLQAGYKALAACRAADPAAAIELVAVEGAEDAAASRRVEAAFIADWIARHCGEGKPARFKDVAVLSRAALPFGELMGALRAAGVPYATDSERGFYGAPEVLDLVNVLRALDDPEDRAAIAGVLRSPLCLASDQQLYELSKAGKLDYRKKSGENNVDLLFAQLLELRGLVGRVPASEVVSAALRETNIQELAAEAYHGAQTVANLAKFARLAAAASDERGLSLKEFVGELLSELDNPKGEGESPLADEHRDAVRLMTIHKSKGLEFPIVFLTNASAAPAAGRRDASCVDWGSSRVGLRLERCAAASAAMAWLAPQEKRRQEHEALRLLYVALTRAKSRLFVVGKDKGASGSFASLLALAGAWPAPEDGGSLAVGAFTLPVRRLAADFSPSARAQAQASPGTPQDLAPLIETRRKRLAACEAAAAGSWTTTPTQAGPPEEAEGARTPALGALVGSLCHKALEAIDFSAPPKGPALAAELNRAAAALSLLAPGADWPAAESEARKVLAGFLASKAARAIAGFEIVGREVPFCYPAGGALARGRLDLLCRRPGGALLVVDYKSERVSERDAASHRERYERQSRLYREAVERALGVTGVEFAVVFLRRPELSSGVS